MRVPRCVSMAMLGLLAMSSAATAHPGHGHEIGAVHVMLSLEHMLAFLGIGAVTGALMLVRRAPAVILANGLLVLFLFGQGAVHAMHGGVLFGIEVAVVGAILAMAGWRATYSLYAQVMAWKRENRP